MGRETHGRAPTGLGTWSEPWRSCWQRLVCSCAAAPASQVAPSPSPPPPGGRERWWKAGRQAAQGQGWTPRSTGVAARSRSLEASGRERREDRGAAGPAAGRKSERRCRAPPLPIDLSQLPVHSTHPPPPPPCYLQPHSTPLRPYHQSRIPWPLPPPPSSPFPLPQQTRQQSGSTCHGSLPPGTYALYPGAGPDECTCVKRDLL